MIRSDHAGYYTCRTIDRPLALRFTRAYGGRVRPASGSWCALAPLPSALPGVIVDDTKSPEVSISWSKPSFAPSGSRVAIKHWSADTCGAVPDWASWDFGSVASGAWRDGSGTEDTCYQVQLVNRYGAGRGPVAARIQRTGAPAQNIAADDGDE